MSTGVDIDNRIRADTSVQIQHVATKRFLYHETKVKFDFKEGEEPAEIMESKEDSASMAKILMIAGEAE